MRYFVCAAILFLAPAYGAERVARTAPKCGQERPVKRSIRQRALGLPGAFEKHFSDLALSVSSIGISQARCEGEAARASNATERIAAHSSEGTLDLLWHPKSPDSQPSQQLY
jgi:hypothetical protein